MADIIYHLYQIIHIDDELLIDLHKLLAQIEQGLALEITLQTDGLLASGNHHLPTALLMIVLEESISRLSIGLKSQGIGIEQELRTLLAEIVVLVRMKHKDVFMG